MVETTDDDVIMSRKSELLAELKASKAGQKLDVLFLAVVNIVAMRSKLLMCGATEEALANLAFGGPHSACVMDMGARVSRKKEFIPPLTRCTQDFDMPTQVPVDDKSEVSSWFTGLNWVFGFGSPN